MVWLRHRGCKNPALEYCGLIPLYGNPVMRHAEWRDPNGHLIGRQTKRILVRCPDCKDLFPISPNFTETCDGSPIRPLLTKERIAQAGFFDRLMFRIFGVRDWL